MKKLSFFVSLVALLAFSTACSTENTDKIIEKAISAQENLNSYYGESTTTFEFDGEKETTTMKEWNVKPNKNRTEMDDNYIHVSNGEKSWSYDKEENTVTVFDDLNQLEDEEMPDEAEIMRELLTEMMDSNEVVVNGKETIADRKTIHLSLTPKENEENDEFFFDANYEIWVDEETYMPLKMKVQSEEFSTEMEYTSIEYNIEIDESLFTFEIPEGATVQTMDDLMPDTLTLEELKEEAAFNVPDFTYIPEGYKFTEATYFGDMEMAMIEFEGEANEDLIMISISTEPSKLDTEEEEAETIKIGDIDGTYMNMFDMQFLSWTEDDLQFEVTSFTEDFSKEELLKVAKGMK